MQPRVVFLLHLLISSFYCCFDSYTVISSFLMISPLANFLTLHHTFKRFHPCCFRMITKIKLRTGFFLWLLK